jgi:hypothetical protein
MQGCFKSSLKILRQAQTGERGQFYSACFNYAIGLERLLKVLLLLDHWHRERKFPDFDTLKQYGGKSGHNLERLYESARNLFTPYEVEWKPAYEPDAINRDLLGFLADFANGSRYFNLNTLAGAPKSEDPIRRWEKLLYRVNAQDVPGEKSSLTGLDAKDPESMSTVEFAVHHTRLAAASPHICWHLIQLIIPMQELLIAIREQVHQDDLRVGGEDTDPSVPYMEAFLEFVCEDKNIILKAEDWP